MVKIFQPVAQVFILLLTVSQFTACGAVGKKMNRNNNRTAFLSLPLETGTDFKITEGWFYSAQEKAIHPKFETHFGVDLSAPRGTPVYAAANGYALSSYQLAYAGEHQGKRIGFGLGNFVQIYHPDAKFFTVYGHLSKVAESIPYFAPEQKDGTAGPTWNPVIVNRPLADILPLMRSVKKGELIGYVGDSGLSWGYDEGPRSRPDPDLFLSWDETHLHFEVYDRDEHGKKRTRLDPFDLYGEASSYQTEDGELVFGPCPLWLLGNDQQPMFAK